MKTALTVLLLQEEARNFAEMESAHNEASLYGVTDGKAVGTYLEHKFQGHLRSQYDYVEGSSAKGIDFPALGVDLKVTSVRQPQSSCPFRAARQKVYGLGYALLVFVYEKTNDERTRTGNLNIRHVIFVEDSNTADFQTTTGIRGILDNAGNVDDIIAFLMDRFSLSMRSRPRNWRKKSCKTHRKSATSPFPTLSSGGSSTGEPLIWLVKWAALPGSSEYENHSADSVRGFSDAR